MKRMVSLLIVSGLTACASAPPSALYVRAGLTADRLSADSDQCFNEGRVAERTGTLPPSDGSPGGAFASGMAKGSSDIQRFLAAHDACFMRLGYRKRPLTPAQQEEFGRLRTDDERGAYCALERGSGSVRLPERPNGVEPMSQGRPPGVRKASDRTWRRSWKLAGRA